MNIRLSFLCISGQNVQQVDAEVALYLRTLCKHLQTEAQSKGSDAAMTTGTEATVYASEASDSNDLLEKILPESVSDYIELIKTHIAAGVKFFIKLTIFFNTLISLFTIHTI